MEAGPNFSVNRGRLVSLAARESVPVMYEWPEFVAEGGLISDGTDLADIFRGAETKLEGVGLVVGLDDTGVDPPPSWYSPTPPTSAGAIDTK